MMKVDPIQVLGRLFGHVLTTEGVSGVGCEHATVGLRALGEDGAPGTCVMVEHGLSRSDVIALAFGLLDIADQMQPLATYSTSSAVAGALTEFAPGNETFTRLVAEHAAASSSVAERRLDTAQRYRLLKERMPTLQLCQRVLERASKDVADTLYAMLSMADQCGNLPFRAGMSVAPSEGLQQTLESALSAVVAPSEDEPPSSPAGGKMH